MNDKMIFSLKDAAEYLGICYNTILKLVNNGSLPAGRVGHQWRISKDNLDRFLSGKPQTGPMGKETAPSSAQSVGIGVGLSATGSYPIYFKLQVLNRYKTDPRYVLEEDETSGRFALKEEFSKTTGHIGVFWAKVREIKFRKAALANGVTVVCLDSEYYARNVGGIVYEYKHWHNYRIHYSNPI